MRTQWTVQNHLRAVAGVVVILLLLAMLLVMPGFMRWDHRVGHNQSGVGLNMLKMGILQYAEDNQGGLPPMTNYTAFHKAIFPYIKSDGAFREFDTETGLYLPNPALSGKKVSAIKRVAVLLYESEPLQSDSSRWVAFVPDPPSPPPFDDPGFAGVRLVKETEWQRLKAAEGIP